MDKFPEAFERFEHKVKVSREWDFDKLVLSFHIWAKNKWRGTRKQTRALGIEAKIKGIQPVERYVKLLREKEISYVRKDGKRISYTRQERVHIGHRNVITGRFEKKE